MDQQEYKCPLCGAAIKIDNVNAATDIALCRACGKTSAFSLVCGAAQISLDCLTSPPRCIRVESSFDGATSIRYRTASAALLFLIPFTAVWSGGSMFGIYGTQMIKGHFDMAKSLFGIPFLLGAIVLCT